MVATRFRTAPAPAAPVLCRAGFGEACPALSADDIEVVREGHGRIEWGLRQSRQKKGGYGKKNGCCLSCSPQQTQDDAGDDAGQSLRQDDIADPLPARPSRLALTVRNSVGTVRNASSAVLMITGRVMMARVKPRPEWMCPS